MLMRWVTNWYEEIIVTLMFLCGVYAIFHLISKRLCPSVSSVNNPLFLKFQRSYLLAYFLALFGEWLQSAYMYWLYVEYEFEESQIAILYVCGAISGVLFGAVTSILADRYGRKKLCVLLTVLYAVSCLMKVSRNYFVLILSRIFSGVCASLMFSIFEVWYIHEHIETHGFPEEWLSITFSQTTFWNGILAVTAGVVANLFAGEIGLDLGALSSYIIAIPFLIGSSIVIATQWVENYGKQKVKYDKMLKESLRHIVFDTKILLIGSIQALFESVMYVFVFLWTPLLSMDGREMFGFIFASFMLCIMIGSTLFQILHARRLLAQHILAGATIVALVSVVMVVVAIDESSNSEYWLLLISFFIFELAVGLYFPAMGFLRTRLLPDSHKAMIMSCFRVPLNVVVCAGLIFLHESPDEREGNRTIFGICAGLLALTLLAVVKLLKLMLHEEQSYSRLQDG